MFRVVGATAGEDVADWAEKSGPPRVDLYAGGRTTWLKNEIIAISGLIILLVLYLFAGFYYSMKRGIQQINTTLAAMAKGDLNRRALVQGRDEIRAIGDNLNHMARQLADLVHIAYSRAPTESTKDPV